VTGEGISEGKKSESSGGVWLQHWSGFAILANIVITFIALPSIERYWQLHPAVALVVVVGILGPSKFSSNFFQCKHLQHNLALLCLISFLVLGNVEATPTQARQAQLQGLPVTIQH
jgi:hypothetical protein